MERTLLSSLPEELISNIACKLGSDDIFAFRSTCRAIQVKSFHEFATEYFSEKCVHFTTDSLKALVDISGSKLAKYVKDLSVVTALFDSQGFQCPGRATTHWRPSVRQSEAYKFYMRDQAELHKTQNDRKMLAIALRSLPSLRILSLIDTPASLSPSTDYRGGNKVFRQTGTRPINGQDSIARVQSKEFQAHLEKLWFTLINALTDASGSKLRLEEFHISFCTDANFLTPKLFSLRPAMAAKLSGVFESVTRLHLHLHLKTPADSKHSKEMFARFTATLPNLKELSLDFDTKKQASGLLFRRFIAGVDHSKLTSLNVTGLSIDAARLTKTIAQLTHLKDLRLYCVEVNSGSWPPVLAAIKKLELTDHLHLMYLRESGCKSYFLKQRDPADLNIPDVLDPSFSADEWDNEDDGDDDDDDDDSDSDDDFDGAMPDLQPVDESWVAQAPASDHAAAPSIDPPPAAAAAATPPVNTAGPQVDDDVMSEYVPDGVNDGIERGFYICIEGHEKIVKRLATFIEEYNVGEFMDPSDDMMGFGAMGAIPVGGGMAIPVAVGAGAVPPPGANVGHTAGGLGAFMNAMGLVGLGPIGGPHPHHHHPPFVMGAAPAPTAAPAPAAGTGSDGGIATTGAGFTAHTPPTDTWNDDAAWVDTGDWEEEGGALVDNVN